MSSEPDELPLAERPRLRPVEAFPIEDGGARYVVLRDPADPAIQPVVVSDGAVPLLALLDGQRTIRELDAALQLRGVPMGAATLRAFLEQLDRAGFLEGPRADRRLQERAEAFQAAATRQAVHAGGAYPDDLVELPRFLAAGFLHPDGPGRLPGERDSAIAPPRGAIVPHVDLHRGAPTYSWAYGALAEAQPADLYVVLGTCHTSVNGGFAATRKPYDTPLGPVPTDASFLERLQRLWGRSLFAGELSHAAEHSIEFQALYLRSLGLAGEAQAPIVPLLCDSLHSLVLPPYSPRDVAVVSDFVDALRQAIREDGRRVTTIAAADLAHVGPRFGDRWAVDAGRLAAVGAADREMLGLVAAADPPSYFAQVMRDNDARRICGFTPIYLLTELMADQGCQGDLLRYTQWVAEDGSSSVTFASMLFR